jgi:hypothetical protein
MSYERKRRLILRRGERMIVVVKRAAGIFTLLALLGVGSGGFDFLHQLDYQRQTQGWAAVAAKHGTPVPPPVSRHDPSNCAICLTLHLPGITPGFSPVIAALGFLAITPLLRSSRPFVARLCLAIDCRGPPLL